MRSPRISGKRSRRAGLAGPIVDNAGTAPVTSRMANKNSLYIPGLLMNMFVEKLDNNTRQLPRGDKGFSSGKFKFARRVIFHFPLSLLICDRSLRYEVRLRFMKDCNPS